MCAKHSALVCIKEKCKDRSQYIRRKNPCSACLFQRSQMAVQEASTLVPIPNPIGYMLPDILNLLEP